MDKIKALFIGIFTVLSAWLGILAVPMYILVILNFVDYLTGLMAAHCRGQKISSYKGIQGITKKICMWLLVLVGVITDWLVIYAAGTAGIEIHINHAIGAFVAVWLICNEIISVLENIGDIGVKPPKFIGNVISKIKGEIDKEE